MLPNHPNGYPGGSNNNGNWQNQVHNPYLPSTPVNGAAPTSGALAIRGTEDYVLTPDEERQLLRTKQIVEEMLTRSRHNKEKAELEARLAGPMNLVATASNASGPGPPLMMQGLSRGQQGMHPSTFLPAAQHPLEPVGSVAHSSAHIVEVPNTPSDQGSFPSHPIQPQQWPSFSHPQQAHRSGQVRVPPDTLGGLYPVGSRTQQQQLSTSSRSNAQPVRRPSASASLPQSYQNFSGPSARLGLRPPSFPTTYQSTNQQSQTIRGYSSNSSGALASAGAAQSSSSGLPSSATPIQGSRTGSAAIPNVVAAAAAQASASGRGTGSPSIPAPGRSGSGSHSARKPNTPHTMHVDVRSKLPPASVITPAHANNPSLPTSAPRVAASTGTIPRSHAEALQKGPILRPPEKGSANSTPSPSIPPASINPAPGSNRPRSGSQAQSSTTVAPGSSRTTVAPPTANKESSSAQPPNLAPPVLMPVRAAPDAPVYTYFLPFGTPNSPAIFYQVTQVQLDSQFNIAWGQVGQKAAGLRDDLQKAILQNLQFVYKHICQTGLRRDDKYHFFIQSGTPGPPVPSAPAVNQTPTNPTNTKPPPVSDPMTGGPAHEGPSSHQGPPMEPARDQAVQQRMDQPASTSSPADAQMASNLASAAVNLLPPLASLSPSQRAIPPAESLSAPPQAGPSTPDRAMSFVEILRQNNPSAQDLADSIIRDLGSPRKNTRKRKFAPESDVETGPSSLEKGRRKSRLDGDPAQARENPSAGPQKDATNSMGVKSASMVSAPGSRPSLPALKSAPVQQAVLFNPYLPTVQTPSAKTLPGDVSVPIKAPGPLPTKPPADSDT
ncbi:hypothetical protein FRC00_010111, partial [Tulasnella sp. 408]